MTLPDALSVLIEQYPKLGVAIRPNRLGGIRVTPIYYTPDGPRFGMVDAIVQSTGRILTANETELTLITDDMSAEDWTIAWEIQ
jgi:hypothetical protein